MFLSHENLKPIIPMTLVITIDGNNIYDIESFYWEINKVFMKDEDWTLGPSLDALNDLLYGGYGVMKGHDQTTITWLAFEKNRVDLGYKCTKDYYLNKISQPEIFNQVHFQKKLQELENDNGQTYFDIILEIIKEHPNIELIAS